MCPEKKDIGMFICSFKHREDPNFDGAIPVLGDYDGISPIGDVRLESV